MSSEEAPRIQQIGQLRELFLHDLEIQMRVKRTADVSDFLVVSIEVARENGLNLITEDDLRQAIDTYAKTGEGASPTCPPNFDNPPPFDPPTLEKAIELFQSAPIDKCSW
ncbi:hypothetical protein V0288_10680 [Pannus brasiliensis CCIBt3594]|uniref:PIN domain-containing protein n=1 Tax=Pannus brasiliensis CCIBt3594 TaxID=1427578 RepID=A0AAW9QVD7_9CHRO